jgi:hypothetical protein
VLRTSEDAGKKTGFVMALTDSASLTSPADSRDGRTNPLANPFAGFRAYFSEFFARAFDPYRPELHYMRGPGPACRAKLAAARRQAN